MRICDRCEGTYIVRSIIGIAAAMGPRDHPNDLCGRREPLFNFGKDGMATGPDVDLCENCFQRLRDMVTKFCTEKEAKRKMYSYAYECANCGKGVHVVCRGLCTDCIPAASNK